ncbi:putative GTP cyclohydrolase-2 [Fulvia fulva]|nr:putative GTP cyclohydrolase-2 [Fulvia fulva]KAK4636731.1 putative GTP cyclohydrolase-2 [Fulvia fulva]WPV24021.1 putative GTP cyclohydrolase-2 [Fulvia fulva]
MPDFPSIASPAITPIASPKPQHHDHNVSDLQLDNDFSTHSAHPPPLVSPAFTPPHTPFANGQRHDRLPTSVPTTARDAASEHGAPKLLERLPEVQCEVRARIPTTTGQEMFLHLYHNSADNKEHLAIVFGPHIRSQSLDAPRPGESERDRMIRGAYTGTLFPGRTHSRLDQIRQDAGVAVRPPVIASGAQIDTSNSISTTASSGSSAQEDWSYSSYPSELGPPLVRIHSECYTGETVWSARCDCGEQLDEAARLMSLPAATPSGSPAVEHAPEARLPSCGGVIVYLRQEGRGIGLLSKLKAYNLQDLGHDTMEANILLRHPGDARSYGLATAILLDLGLGGERGIRLLTNNPEKIRAVEGPNREVRVTERVPMIPLAWKTDGKEGINSPEVEKYISTKIEKFKHMFSST